MKKLLVSFATGMALILPTISAAVGLGGIKVYTKLNQKLNAEIPILAVDSTNRKALSVSMGSNEDFARRGLDKAEIVRNVNLSIVNKAGRSYVKVSSNQLINVPYLNFIINLNSNDGTVSREYAIFLDPVGGVQGVKSSTSKASPKSKYTSSKLSNKKKASYNNRVAVSNQRGTKYGPIRRGETLWSIAKHARPSERVSVQAMMNAIIRANPRAFPNRRANDLPAGVMITIPTIKGYAGYKGGFAPMPYQAAIKKNSQSKPAKSAQMQGDAAAKKPKAEIRPPKSDTSDSNSVTSGSNAEDSLSESLGAQESDSSTSDRIDDKDTSSSSDDSMSSSLDDASQSSTGEISDTAQLEGSELDDSSDNNSDLESESENSDDQIISSSDANDSEAANNDGEASNLQSNTGEDDASLVAKTQTQATSQTQAQSQTQTQAQQKTNIQPVAKKPVSVKPKYTKPAFKAPVVEKTLIPSVPDIATYTGAGLAGLALLGGAYLLSRRRKNYSIGKGVVLTDESDIEEYDPTSVEALDDEVSEEIVAIDDDLDTDLDDFSELEDLDELDESEPVVVADIDEALLSDFGDELDTDFEDLDLSDDAIDDNETELSDLDDDFDFDLDDSPNLDMSSDKDSTDAILLTNDDDFDFNFDDSDEFEVESSDDNDTQNDLDFTTSEDLDGLDDLSLDIDDGNISDEDEVIQDDFDLDLDDSADFDEASSEVVLETIQDSADNTSSEKADDFDFDFEADQEDGLDFDSDFDLDGELDFDEVESDKVDSGQSDFANESMNADLDNEKDIESYDIGEFDSDSELEDLLADSDEPIDLRANIDTQTTELDSEEFEEDSASFSDETPIMNVSKAQMKLDLAHSFNSIGENMRASDLLNEVLEIGDEEQVAEAKSLLENLS